MGDSEGKFRGRYAIALGCVVVLWTLGSWTVWSELGVKLKGVPLAKLVFLPVGILSWPAHEICLELSGQGYGAQNKVPATLFTLLIFAVQAAIVWLPMAVPCLRRRTISTWLIFQAVVFLALFSSFWHYGNG